MTKDTPDERPRARIFIVDDHPVVRHGLRELISAESDSLRYAVKRAASPVLAGIEQARPDLVLIDAALRGSGLGLLKRLHTREDAARSLMVSDA